MGSGSGLHQTLKSFCFNTDWSYAVFWKLKHRAPMVLAWEDAYYNSCGPDSLHDGNYSHDLLGSAVAMMSSHVYSLGEGIVGQVAVTGKHKWIMTDGHSNSSCSSFVYGDGWQNQFSAGIRTIVVVSVVPHGVLQLGSLNEVVEDTNLVTHIRNLFFTLQGSSMVSNMMECNASFVSPLPSICHTKAVEVFNKHGGPETSISGGDVITTSLNPKLNIIKPEHQSRVGKELVNVSKYEGETSGSKELSVGSEHNIFSYPTNSVMDSINGHSQIFPVEKFRVNLAGVGLDCEDLHKNAVLHSNDSSIMKIEEELQKFQTESTQFDTFLKFSTGCELYEALGPAFQKKSVDFEWEGGKIETGTNLEAPLEMSSNKLRSDSGSEHLLEAVVANFCHSGSENMQEPSSHTKLTVNSSGYSIDRPSLIEEGLHNCLSSSELSGVMSSKGFSSPCPSTCSEQLERSSGPGKNKKRARPGESCRPRPRDRQLIQDRIKELRELVPSGSKCSIDSLLERTIKHMLFLQSITKHADKLNKCSDMKLHSKEMSMHESTSCEQGSSWAVEIGSHLKVCSIIVENLDKNGQMLVEMVCEECSHFLEIAEAIRSLGLTILKGVTEARSDKTWICFVVEGQNNRSIHRMDILWSLVQILQPNATV